jgi:putative copper resistance protein D
MDDATLAALRTAASALFDVGLATMIGALATAALLRDASSAWAAQRRRRCQRLFTLACTATLVASLAWMELQAIALTELSPGPALLAAGGVIVDTQFGRAWAPGALALVVGVVLAAASRYRAPPLRWFALIAAVVVVSHACAGHAGANGRVWPVLVMSLHLLSMGAWSGAVFAAATTVLRADVDAADGARYAIRLSMLASAALAGIVLTGISSAWHGLGGTLEPLMPATATTWGVVLDVKLGLVAAAVALGGFNRVVVMPALLAKPGSPTPWRRFTGVLRLEAVVLLAALVAAALLANGEPPAV